MEQTSKETLVKVINLIKQGDKKTAIPLLTALLKKEPELEQGWYLLGMALDGSEKKARAFNQVLKLNPNHEKAKKQLAKLEGEAPSPLPAAPASPPPIFPDPEPTPQEPPQESAQSVNPFGEPAFLQDDSFQGGFADFESESDDTDFSPSSQADFELPDWMQQDSFNAADQLPQITEPFNSPDSENSGTPWESATEEEISSDIPDWAKSSQPPPAHDLSEQEDTPSWMEERLQPAEEPAKQPEAKIEPAFTGYSLDDSESPLFDDEKPLFDDDDDETYEDEIGNEGEPEWLRSMVEEDDNGKKKKKKKKRTKVERSPKEKKQRRRRIFLIAMVLLCGGLSAAYYFFEEQIHPYYASYVEPYVETYAPMVMTQAAPVTDLLTEGAPLTDLLTPEATIDLTPSATAFMTPTLAPTWTPAQTQVPSRTAYPSSESGVTPTPSQTSLPLDSETVLEMETIQEQAVEIRGLPGPSTVDADVIPSLKLKMILEDWMMNGSVAAELQDDEIAYKALGFVNSNYDLVTEALNSRVDSIGGFYLPENNMIYVVGNGFFGIQKYIYAHEYTHAIQDANFDLTSLGVYPNCTLAEQTCLAIMALIEGDATISTEMWLNTYPPELEYQDILSYTPTNLYFQGITPPVYFEQNTLFPYSYGEQFVQYLYDNGGWGSVNRAYQYPPETTEQIIHPEKYDAREAPLRINFPDLTAIARDGWQIIRSDSLGEWESFLLLAYNDFSYAQQPIADAEVAAAGWGGDQYAVLYNADTNKTLLTVYWDWDSQKDSDEFYSALSDYLASRYRDTMVDDASTGTCWELNNVRSCIYRQDKQILWLQSDDLEILDAAKEMFIAFP